MASVSRSLISASQVSRAAFHLGEQGQQQEGDKAQTRSGGVDGQQGG